MRRGLLYAGTELGVFLSFNDGDHWQSLQHNLPLSPVHDLVVHGTDLIAATHGRSLWILDDVTPLRQVTPGLAGTAMHLFRPTPAIRLRRSENHDTPMPPEVPRGDNGPTGAVIDYWLASSTSDPVVLDVLDSSGRVLRHFGSDQPTDTIDAVQPHPPPFFSTRWLPQLATLTANAGHNRFVWDLRLPRPSATSHTYSSNVVPLEGGEVEPAGPLVVPGVYRVRLTVHGASQAQPLVVSLDPRVRVTSMALRAQLALALQTGAALTEATTLARAVRATRDSLATRQPAAPSGLRDAMAHLEHALDSLHFGEIGANLGSLETAIESADRKPTAGMDSVYSTLRSALTAQHERWRADLQRELRALDAQLVGAGLQPVGGS